MDKETTRKVEKTNEKPQKVDNEEPQELDKDELSKVVGGNGGYKLFDYNGTAPNGLDWAPGHSGHGGPGQGE